MALQVWFALGSAELLRKQVNGAGERALSKGDKSIRKTYFYWLPNDPPGEARRRRRERLKGDEVLLLELEGGECYSAFWVAGRLCN